MEEEVRGFILQPTYRVEAGRPAVLLWGRLESGETFVARDRRVTPGFWILAADVERARRHGVASCRASRRVTMRGRPVARVEVTVPADAPPLRDRLQRAGIRCYEADVRFAMRYLIDRGIRGAVAVRGTWRKGRGVNRIYDDPELAPADWTPELSVLSVDIETDPRARRILSIAWHGCGAAGVLVVAAPGGSDRPALPEGMAWVGSDRELLEVFAARVRKLDPDVLTGWNLVDFDVPVLLRRAEAHGLRFELGRGRGALHRRPGRGAWQATRVTLPGRLVLDGLWLLRGAFVRMERYGLDAVAREVLGEGKTLTGGDRATEILRRWREDPVELARYNLQDARLVNGILEKLDLVALAVERSRLTGLPPDRVSGSVAAFDVLYLTELGRRGIVAPSVGAEPAASEGSGGHVFSPEPGLYENVVVLDVKSLYPSLMRTFQIDPLGFVEEPAPGDDLIVAPNGAAFGRQPSILTGLLDELFPRREAARRAGNATASHAIKILMNSFFGVLGTPVCRFYNPAIADAITSFGRELLLHARGAIEGWGYGVLYGDTDSLFVASGLAEPDAASALGRELIGRLEDDLSAWVEERWRVESRLELELERLYLRLFLPPLRHGGVAGAEGARKRYAGLVEVDGRRRVVFTGLEAVRRDWTELARAAQRELYGRLFDDRPVHRYLRRLVAELRAGEHDERLVYRKSLRKGLEEYTSTTPPHVAAARKLSRRPGRTIAYVVTKAGPEPAAERRHPLDHDHYVDRQIRPVAEPVLEHLGLDFAKVIGDDRQLDLF